MKSYSYTELAELTGEVLPERAVLSTLLVGGGNGGHSIVPNCATNVVNQSGSPASCSWRARTPPPSPAAAPRSAD